MFSESLRATLFSFSPRIVRRGIRSILVDTLCLFVIEGSRSESSQATNNQLSCHG